MSKQFLGPYAVLVFLLSFVLPAQAQDKTQAKEQFDKGSELFQHDDYAGAADAFRRAYVLSPTWKLLYNIGQSEAAAKRYGLALQTFEQYLVEGGDEIPNDRRDSVMEEIDRLRKIVGYLEVEAPDGSVVIIDGIERDKTPLPGPLPIAASVTHELTVKKGDVTLKTRQVRVGGGMVTTVKIESDEADPVVSKTETKETATEETSTEPTVETDPAAEEQEESNTLRVAGWVTTGLGAAILVGGAVTGGMAITKDEQLATDCKNDGLGSQSQCDPKYNDDIKAVDNLALTTNILVGVGAAAAIAGVIMIIVSYKNGEEETKVALSPAFDSGFAGATISGRF